MEWKNVVGYDGIYVVSDKGDVMRCGVRDSRGHLRNPKILKTTRNSFGYLVVGLTKDNVQKKYLVHRLVAEAFCSNPNHFIEVNHKDENKENNSSSNLEWCDHLYNIRYGTGMIRQQEARKSFYLRRMQNA